MLDFQTDYIDPVFLIYGVGNAREGIRQCMKYCANVKPSVIHPIFNNNSLIIHSSYFLFLQDKIYFSFIIIITYDDDILKTANL